MKTQDTYGKKQFRPQRPTACRSLPAFVCVLSVILCLMQTPAAAVSESNASEPNNPTIAEPNAPTVAEPNDPAVAEPNAPAVAEPNDPNNLQTPPQNAAPEPNQPPKPTIEDQITHSAVTQLAPKSARRDWLIAGLPKSDLARRIWRERITVPQEDEAGDRKIQLQQLIDRIRSIEFKPQEPPQEPIIVIEQSPPVEPNATAVEPADQNQPESRPKQTVNPKSQNPTVSEETLKILADQLKQPQLLKNPFELGEIMFNAGHLAEAAVCYRQALTRIDPNQPDPIQKRPWIMFQIGNCLRKDHPAKASEAYSQLITEHGGSLWAEPAKAQARLIAWRLSDKPKLLIEQSRPKPVKNALPVGLIKNNEAESLTEPRKGEQTQNK